jgi:hypothetical protein
VGFGRYLSLARSLATAAVSKFPHPIDKCGRVSDDACECFTPEGSLPVPATATRSRHLSTAERVIFRGFILLEEGVDQESPVYSRGRDADAVQAISTTCSRSSFIFNPATKRSIVSKLFYFCLPATLNPP